MRLRDIPLAHKLTAIIMVTSCTVLLLACAGVALHEYLEFHENVNQQMSTLGEVVARNATAALAFNDSRTAGELLASLHAEPDLLRAAVFSLDGKVFAQYRRDPGAEVAAHLALRPDGTYFEAG